MISISAGAQGSGAVVRGGTGGKIVAADYTNKRECRVHLAQNFLNEQACLHASGKQRRMKDVGEVRRDDDVTTDRTPLPNLRLDVPLPGGGVDELVRR